MILAGPRCAHFTPCCTRFSVQAQALVPLAPRSLSRAFSVNLPKRYPTRADPHHAKFAYPLARDVALAAYNDKKPNILKKVQIVNPELCGECRALEATSLFSSLFHYFVFIGELDYGWPS